MSCGVDSALVLVLAERALGKENVKAVLMPSEYSSQHSIDDAIHLCSNLGVVYETIPIKNLYESYLNTLTPFFQNKAFNLTEENLQARIRAGILMALCNKHNYILLNTMEHCMEICVVDYRFWEIFIKLRYMKFVIT